VGKALDIFECLSDGTKLWREAIVGAECAKKRIEELATTSNNRFAAIDLLANRVVANSNGAITLGVATGTGPNLRGH